MPNDYPRDGFFYPTLTLRVDSYNLNYYERQEDFLPTPHSPCHVILAWVFWAMYDVLHDAKSHPCPLLQDP